ncbi:MAG: YCF48-related protein [Bacteroidota bacterium]|nr:YCF48-related protein [Bacteroidota bacterium]MDP4229823.1 YCF48-related protein [Bacteroidota bacterium]MDP4236416.1 YCF48-related protein [Bacteroidota bacterium]
MVKINIKLVIIFITLAPMFCTLGARAQLSWQITHLASDWRFSYTFNAVSCNGEDCTATGLIRDALTDKVRIIFWRSDDGGSTWEIQDPELPFELGDNQNQCIAIQQIDAQNIIAVGDTGLILRTFDGGISWERQQCNSSAFLRNVHFANPYSGIVISSDTSANIYTTSDGGRQWRTSAFSSANIVQCHCYGPGDYSVFDIGQGRFYRTRDNWLTVDSTSPILDSTARKSGYYISYCKYTDGDTIFVCGNQFNPNGGGGVLMRSVNNGSTWEQPMLFPSFTYLRFMTSLSRDTVLAAGGSLNHILFSSDRGSSWRDDSLVLDTDYHLVYCFGLEAVGDGGFVGVYPELPGRGIPGGLSFPGVLVKGQNVKLSVTAPGEIERMRIFPNPATNEVTIASTIGNESARVFDVLGRQVLQGELSNAGKLTFDTRKLPRGYYNIFLYDKGKVLREGKFEVIGSQ